MVIKNYLSAESLRSTSFLIRSSNSCAFFFVESQTFLPRLSTSLLNESALFSIFPELLHPIRTAKPTARNPLFFINPAPDLTALIR